jgi:NADH-quinone oxidoreductase subunit D
LRKDLKNTKISFYNNPLFRQRTKNVGILTKQDAIDLGVTGSVLRASGVAYDVRKVEPYDVYEEIDLKYNI